MERTPRTLKESVFLVLGGMSLCAFAGFAIATGLAGGNVDEARGITAAIESGEMHCRRTPPDFEGIACNDQPVPARGEGEPGQVVLEHYQERADSMATLCMRAGLGTIATCAGAAGFLSHGLRRA